MHPTIKQYEDRISSCWKGLNDKPMERRLSDSLSIIREVDHLNLPYATVLQFKAILHSKMEECKTDFLKTESYCQMAGVSRKGLGDILENEIRDIFG